jgi:hypothetical protein
MLGGCGPSEPPPCHPTEDGGLEGGATVMVSVGATAEPCPQIVSVVAAPDSVGVGRSLSLFSTFDVIDGGYVSFQWTAPSGTFEDPQAASTKFVCGDQPGIVELTLTAIAGDCHNSQSVAVGCHAL